MTPPTYAELRAAMPRSDGEACIFAHDLRKWIDGEGAIRLNINPDYQRGHVWTEAQAAAFVGHRLEGGDSPTLTIQRWADNPVDEIVDGKQRITAVLDFVEGRIPALLSDGGLYYLRDWTPEDQGRILHGFQLMLRARTVMLPTRADVLRLYLRLNRGGSIHTDAEIERVRVLLAAELAGMTSCA